MNGLDMISADELDRYVGRPDVFLIDLRDAGEYRQGHVRGAVNLPYDEWEERTALDRLPPRKLIVLYCDRGAASLAKGRELAGLGFWVCSVTGGFHAYRGKNIVC